MGINVNVKNNACSLADTAFRTLIGRYGFSPERERIQRTGTEKSVWQTGRQTGTENVRKDPGFRILAGIIQNDSASVTIENWGVVLLKCYY